MSDWDEFTGQLLDALRRFVQGDAEPLKRLWSHGDDVTIFGGWGAYEQGWAAVEPRLDWAASRYSEGWLDRENLLEGVDHEIAYSVDIERSGGRFDNAPEIREALRGIAVARDRLRRPWTHRPLARGRHLRERRIRPGLRVLARVAATSGRM